MTRKEEILQAVNNYKNHFPDGFINEYVYVDGAEWADENPDERMIAKYLYEKKGYPIDLNGHLPIFDEVMKDVEKYNKYKENKFSKKVENFLEMLGDGFTIIDNITYANYDKEQLIEDFRKYTKGGITMKGITKEVVKQDFKTIHDMVLKYKTAIYENQEGQPAHFDNQSKLCRLLMGDIRCGLTIAENALNFLREIEIIED